MNHLLRQATSASPRRLSPARPSRACLARAASLTVESLESRRLLAAAGGDFEATDLIDNTFLNQAGFDSVEAAAVQSDGKLVAALTTTSGLGENLTLLRFNVDGTRDTSFGVDGAAGFFLPAGFTEINPNDLEITPGGDILVSGVVDSGPGTADGMFAFKADTNGSAVNSFGSFGYAVFTGVAGDAMTAFDAVARADGSVLVAGRLNRAEGLFEPETLNDLVVVQFDQFGNLPSFLDTSYAGGTPDFYNGQASQIEDLSNELPSGNPLGDNVASSEEAATIVLRPGGGFLLVSEIDPLDVAADKFTAIVAFDDNSSRDTSFGNNGLVVSNIQVGEVRNAVVSGGAIYVGFENSAGDGVGVLKLDFDGNLDTTYGTAGVASYTLDTVDAWNIDIDEDGRVVGALEVDSAGLKQAALVRFDAAGLLDTSFADDGVFEFDITDGDDPQGRGSVSLGNGSYAFFGNYDDAGTDGVQSLLRKVEQLPAAEVTFENGVFVITGTDLVDNLVFQVDASDPTLISVLCGNMVLATEAVTRIEIAGGDGDDTFDASGVDVTVIIDGGAGNDTIIGGSATDFLNGGEGDDSLVGGDSGDLLLGGAGNDNIDAGNGNDVVGGGDGDDVILGGDGWDLIAGNAGNDHIQSGAQ
ncbi:MAG: hypothetical protein AAGK78_02525, partial [Planctomycetota bacterium]